MFIDKALSLITLTYEFNSISLQIVIGKLLAERIIVDWILKHVLEVTSNDRPHPGPIFNVVIAIFDIYRSYGSLLCHIVDVSEIMSKVVRQFIEVFSSFLVNLKCNIIFKETIIAREDDGVNWSENFVSRITSLCVVLISILPVDCCWTVVENTKIALADGKVARYLSYWGSIQVPPEGSSYFWILLDISKIFLENWLCLICCISTIFGFSSTILSDIWCCWGLWIYFLWFLFNN